MSVSSTPGGNGQSDRRIADTTAHHRRWSEEPFRVVADLAPALIWLSGPDTRCTHVNRPWLAFTGRTLEDQLGDGWRDSIHPDDLPNRVDMLSVAVERHEPFTVEYRLRRHDGEYRWIRDSGMPHWASDGSLIGYIGSCVDIDDLKHAQAELVYSTERLRLALESGKSLAWEWDLEAGRDTCFGDLHTILGLAENTFVGSIDDFRHGLHPDDRDRVLTAIDEAKHHREIYEEEFRVRWQNGTVRWVAAKGRFYYAADGQATRMLGIATDITERRQSDEALLRKQSELTEAQRLASIGSWQWDRDTGRIVWSEELFRITGLEPGSVAALDAAAHPQLYPPRYWEQIARAANEALRSGTPYELDVEMFTADGSPRWVTARGEAQRDASGRICGLRGTVQDITERKRAQQALSDSEERLRLAAEAGKMFAYTWNAATDAISRSGESSHILGIDAEAPVSGQQIVARIHPDDRERVLAALSALSPEQPHLMISYRMYRPDGSLIWVERNSRAYFDERGTLVRIIGMVADITQRKLAEEALSSLSRRLLEAQETERARIARDLHDDVSQRLALVSIALEQLKQLPSNQTADFHRSLDAVQRQTAEIAADVQALSHELHSSKLQLLGVVAAMSGFCAEISERQQVEVVFTHEGVPDSLPPDIALCLFRVLQESLRNAVQHSAVREFTVHLQGTPTALGLTVRDAGHGFDPESALHGRGLGLTSMKERLKLVGGDLAIDSQVADGTTIVARVPLPVSHAGASLA